MAAKKVPAAGGLASDRQRLIQLLHVGRRALAMADDAWRHYLMTTFGAQSSTQLSMPQLQAARNHLVSRGFQPTLKSGKRQANEWAFVDSAAPARRVLLRKIIMLMQEIGLRRGIERGQRVAYVEGIAQQMSGFRGLGNAIETPLPMCGEEQLQRIVVALTLHLQRLVARVADDASTDA